MKNRCFLIITGVILAATALAMTLGSDDGLLLKIHRGIDLFGKVYREVTLNYVDEVDPDRFIRAGIDGMLEHLDPYTVYYDVGEQDEIDLVTTGKYGGIGVTIGRRDSHIVILNILEGFSASRQGLEVGDRILAIDGKRLDSLALQGVRLLVRGAPGTEVRMTVQREGIDEPLEFVLIREEISLRNVTYSGFVRDGIAYIRLERFSRTAGEDLRKALKEYQGKPLKGLILDLRDNPGGLLEMAVDVAGKFLPENSLVVSTRGRRRDSERRYHSQEKPTLADVPLVVLVNRASASSSEIVAGAIQDHDRGLIVGNRTFGKGLVQTITRLSDNTSLKITTARYYTPSGRSIQEIDYTRRDRNGDPVVVRDTSRAAYFTVRQRPVAAGTGIHPDTLVAERDPGPFVAELNRRAMFFLYANRSARLWKEATAIQDTAGLLEDFGSFLRERGFDYRDPVEMVLASVKMEADRGRYARGFFEDVERLEARIRDEKDRAVERYAPELRRALRNELAGRLHGEQARIAGALPDDPQVQVAADILDQPGLYERLLAGKR